MSRNSSFDSTNYNTDDTGEAVRQLNSLLRGEISAAETYRMAIDKIDDSDDQTMANVNLLREIYDEHSQACDVLRDRIRDLGGEPADSSGAWGLWAKTVQGTASLFGDASSLKALKEGEEHGLKDYQEAVDDLDSTTQQLVQSELIPAQQRHISLIDQLIDTTGRA